MGVGQGSGRADGDDRPAASVSVPAPRRSRYTTEAEVETLVRRCLAHARSPARRLSSRLNWVEPIYFGVVLTLTVFVAAAVDTRWDLVVPLGLTIVVGACIAYTPEAQRALVGEGFGSGLVAGREEPVLAARSRTAAG